MVRNLIQKTSIIFAALILKKTKNLNETNTNFNNDEYCILVV
jgi:hypothetical protein